ncbi:TRAP transporter large permease [Stappia sp. TSB10GB4]|uniref:TRAP transporter large permease n=1 Tax=Stappia sp. TSB10GB4 TaxID=2003584 RepID=UPI0016461CB2|nr:TRAP transporter large permease [Stappia sp. TSB10GB4]
MSASLAFVVLMFIGLPLGLVLTAAGMIGAYSIGGADFLGILADRFYSGVSGYVLIAVPYFIITAEIMNRAGLTERLIAFASSLFGRVPGALSHVNVTTCLMFAGLTGAAVTETAAIGRTLIPSMRKEGYSAAYCAAVTACSAIVGPIIPPSIIMIAYAATLRDISILGLFAAGIVPGLMMGLAMLIVSGIISWKRGYASHQRVMLSVIVATGLSALAAMGIPLVILGGVLTGLTTVTEASVIACIYALVLGGFAYRRLTRRDLWESLVSTVSFSGVVFLLLGASNVLGWFVTRSGIARHAAETIATMSDNPVVQILAVAALLVVIGMFIDVLPAIIIAVPVLAPALVELGFHPLHAGMVMLLALNLGNITPPVGLTLMTAARIANAPYESAVRESLPFAFAHVVIVVLCALFPTLTLLVPRLFGVGV